MATVSIRELARRVGVSHVAVRKAALEGRLTEGVRVDGRTVEIVDADAAAAQWSAAPRPSLSDGGDDMQSAYWAAKTRRESALADLAEIEVAEKRGELVSVDEAEARWTDTVTTIKTKILGIPTRVAQQLPKIAAEVVPVIDALLREALEEIAETDGDMDK